MAKKRSSDRLLTEFPEFEEPLPRPKRVIIPRLVEPVALEPDQPTQKPARKSWWVEAWQGISRAGLGEVFMRLGTHALLLASILVVSWAMREFYLRAQEVITPQALAQAEINPAPTQAGSPPALALFEPAVTSTVGLGRQAQLHTELPSRPRVDVTQYTVQVGDTVFGIAEKFNLKPETVLWANQAVLGDNPHSLRPGQELNILPIDGTYHRWSAGDGLNGVAKFFQVNPEDIVNYPGNDLDLTAIGDFAHPSIEPGTWLIIPGGRREFVSWSAPVIPREKPEVANVLGPGACTSVANGAVGSSAFTWPANHHYLSGFDYAPDANHPAIDIDGETGDPVYAADSGVVVYAGWNNWGYGNMVVINHGNGWQTLYAHLNAYNVACGQSVSQGDVLGAIGATGNATGSHLHFEMMYNGVKVNPHSYLP
jgi:murein DD-endopeptidase MepM/ murein hydrolase activator NlpD